MTLTICPKCNREFRVQSNLKYRPRPKFDFKFQTNLKNLKFIDIRTDINMNLGKMLKNLKPPPTYEMIHNPSLVDCPDCGNDYNAPEHKFIGKFQLLFFILLLF